MFSVMLIIFAILLGADVMIKRWVEDELNREEERVFPGGRLILRKVYNKGFLLNLFDKHPKAVKGMSVFAGAGVLMWDFLIFVKKRNYVRKLGMTLVSAGAASNLFDRLAKGKVIDYIGLQTEKKFFGKITANLGDIYLVCGGALVMAGEMLSVVLHRDKTKK